MCELVNFYYNTSTALYEFKIQFRNDLPLLIFFLFLGILLSYILPNFKTYLLNIFDYFPLYF